MNFRARLEAIWAARRAKNRRYSLRAFARSLRADHSTLSKMLSAKRRMTQRSIRTLGGRLNFSAAELAEYCALENESVILGMVADPRFRADSRWLAMMLNIPVDDVNVALQRLLRKGVLRMRRRQWQEVNP